MLAEEKLGGLRVFLSVQIVDFALHFVLLSDLLLANAGHVDAALHGLDAVGVDQVLLVEQQTQQLLLQLVVLRPALFVDAVLRLHFDLRGLAHWVH